MDIWYMSVSSGVTSAFVGYVSLDIGTSPSGILVCSVVAVEDKL
jgi:hypothetical protein